MPDAAGKFKGIAVPVVPWHRPKPSPAPPKHRDTDGARNDAQFGRPRGRAEEGE